MQDFRRLPVRAGAELDPRGGNTLELVEGGGYFRVGSKLLEGGIRVKR